jgi:hypothetical protein
VGATVYRTPALAVTDRSAHCALPVAGLYNGNGHEGAGGNHCEAARTVHCVISHLPHARRSDLTAALRIADLAKPSFPTSPEQRLYHQCPVWAAEWCVGGDAGIAATTGAVSEQHRS